MPVTSEGAWVMRRPEEPDSTARLADVVAAAAAGDHVARMAVDAVLVRWDADPATADVAAALHRILDGADVPARDGALRPDHAALLAAVRARLAAAVDEEPEGG